MSWCCSQCSMSLITANVDDATRLPRLIRSIEIEVQQFTVVTWRIRLWFKQCKTQSNRSRFNITIIEVKWTIVFGPPLHSCLQRSVKASWRRCLCVSVCLSVSVCLFVCLYVHVSVCQGQWLNNVFNGEGKLTQVSGASYEGLWINGRPAYTAVKLVITGLADTGSIRVAPGQSFTVSVECHTEYGEVMPGRNVSLCPLFHSSASCIFHVMNWLMSGTRALHARA